MSLAMELRSFAKPLVKVDYPAPRIAPCEVRVRLLASGVCGSDRHIASGEDPRAPLPMILGHEGVGEVIETAGDVQDVVGRPVSRGDRILWDRGVTCGECRYCRDRRQSFLCKERRVYGINVSSKEPPHLRGAFAEEIVLFPHTSVFVLPPDADHVAFASAACSGATAVHTVEEAQVGLGDTVVVMGPGPLGLWCAAVCKTAGAAHVILTGTRDDRLEMGRLFGADTTINVRNTDSEERARVVREHTDGAGADRVIDTAGTAEAMAEALRWLRPGGVYANSGVAVPVDDVRISVYDLNRRNIAIKGVWVSGKEHFVRAAQLVAQGTFPFQKMVTHRLPLARADEALIMGKERGVMKVVLTP